MKPKTEPIYELKEKPAAEVVVGEIVFVPAWEEKYDFYSFQRKYKKGTRAYQDICNTLIGKCGYRVRKTLDKFIVLYPLAKTRIDTRLLWIAESSVISTGVIS